MPCLCCISLELIDNGNNVVTIRIMTKLPGVCTDCGQGTKQVPGAQRSEVQQDSCQVSGVKLHWILCEPPYRLCLRSVVIVESVCCLLICCAVSVYEPGSPFSY